VVRVPNFSRSWTSDAGTGRFPGLRFCAAGLPSRSLTSGFGDPLLTAYSCGYSQGYARGAPCSLLTLLGPILGRMLTFPGPKVKQVSDRSNRSVQIVTLRAVVAQFSLGGMATTFYNRGHFLVSRATSSAVKREAGARRIEFRAIPALPPQR